MALKSRSGYDLDSQRILSLMGKGDIFFSFIEGLEKLDIWLAWSFLEELWQDHLSHKLQAAELYETALAALEGEAMQWIQDQQGGIAANTPSTVTAGIVIDALYYAWQQNQDRQESIEEHYGFFLYDYQKKHQTGASRKSGQNLSGHNKAHAPLKRRILTLAERLTPLLRRHISEDMTTFPGLLIKYLRMSYRASCLSLLRDEGKGFTGDLDCFLFSISFDACRRRRDSLTKDAHGRYGRSISS